MKWRIFGLVGLLAIGAAGCSGEKPAPNTTPIRTETVPPAPPSTVAPAPTTTAAVATVVAPVVETTVAVSTRPQPIAADYRVRIINNATPKTDLEREALDAALELLIRLRRFQLLETKNMEVLAEVLTGEALERFVPDRTREQPVVAIPSKDDRMLIESVTAETADSVAIAVCLFDGATLYEVATNGSLVFDNSDFGSAKIALQVTKSLGGWRISKNENLTAIVGVDQCAK